MFTIVINLGSEIRRESQKPQSYRKNYLVHASPKQCKTSTSGEPERRVDLISSNMSHTWWIPTQMWIQHDAQYGYMKAFLSGW